MTKYLTALCRAVFSFAYILHHTDCVSAQAVAYTFLVRLFLSQALSGFLSGFYFRLMIYHPAIKTQFTGALEA